jgi:hypothetical protein
MKEGRLKLAASFGAGPVSRQVAVVVERIPK